MSFHEFTKMQEIPHKGPLPEAFPGRKWCAAADLSRHLSTVAVQVVAQIVVVSRADGCWRRGLIWRKTGRANEETNCVAERRPLAIAAVASGSIIRGSSLKSDIWRCPPRWKTRATKNMSVCRAPLHKKPTLDLVTGPSEALLPWPTCVPLYSRQNMTAMLDNYRVEGDPGESQAANDAVNRLLFFTRILSIFVIRVRM
jgi:hypothetical protein